MDFKIDTKDTFTLITPHSDTINAKMADALALQIAEMRQSGSYNYIIDLNGCPHIEQDSIAQLLALHEDCYNGGESFVLTGVQEPVYIAMKAVDEDRMLNIAPRMDEAIDIVSMEILERDLLNEE
jgi:anti-anti-sigma regulatory factor